MSLSGNIAEGSAASIAVPPSGEVTPFFNTAFSPSRLYYKDSTDTIYPFPNGSDLENQCADMMQEMIDKITCALTQGNLTMADFILFVAQGVTITGTSTDDGAGNQTCNVTLSPTMIAVTGISTTPAIGIAVLGTAPIVATVTPANATNKTVYYFSSNVSIATVDMNTGVVTGVGVGVCIVTGVTADGGFTDTTTVTVS